MKKILAIALALVLVLSMGMVALAEDPVQGTKDNPYQVSNPMYFTNSIDVPANTTVYYAYNMQFFNGMSLIVSGVDAVTVNDVEADYSPADWGFKAELVPGGPNPMYPCVVGYVNNTDEAVTAYVRLVQPIGTEDNKQQLEEGNTVIEPSLDVLNATMGVYYCETYVNWTGGLNITATNIAEGATEAGFEIVLEYDEYDEEWNANTVTVPLTADADGVVAGSADVPEWTPVNVIIVLTGMDIPVIDLTVSGPELGSEARPYPVYSVSELEDLCVPAGSTLYVDLWCLEGATHLYVDHALSATADGEEVTDMELEDAYSMSLVLTNETENDVCYPIWLDFPYGSENNPEYVDYADNEVSVQTEGVNAYFFVYYAMNDGTVTVKLDDVSKIEDMNVSNVTVLDNPDYDNSDYEKYSQYISNNADKDEDGYTIYDENYYPVYSDPSQYFATVNVSKGDEVIIKFMARSDDNWQPLPMEAVMTIDAPEAPVGAYENPAEFKDGKNEFTVLAEDYVYVGTWVAPADGLLSVTVVGDVMEFAMGDEEGDDAVYMSEGDELKLKVKKGQTIIMISLPGLDENDVFVDTDVALTIDFEADEVEENDSPATGAAGAGVAVLLTLISGAGLAVLNKKRNA